MGTRKCTARQLAALKRGREKLAHKRSGKTTNYKFGDISRTFWAGNKSKYCWNGKWHTK